MVIFKETLDDSTMLGLMKYSHKIICVFLEKA